MELNNISVHYEDKSVYNNFSIVFPEKKITCLMGASGCGKTTLLNVIADLVSYDGSVLKETTNTGYIFQNPTLFSHMTVEQNIKYVLSDKKINKQEKNSLVDSILKEVGLYEDRKKYPSELSGGMAQRVSLARAFVYQSDLLLLDEPFKGLDFSLKRKLISTFLSLREKESQTAVVVTHDLDEAILLSDKLYVLGNNAILYENVFPRRNSRSIDDYPEIKKEIYKFL